MPIKSCVIVGDVVPVEELSASPAVARAMSLLRTAGLAFGNLEAAVSRRGAPAEKLYSLRADPNSIDGLYDLGFRVMTVANNHALDYGVEAFLDTLSTLKQKGILPVGGGQHTQEAWQPAILSLDGLRIAFLGAASTLPPGFAAGEDRPGIAPIHVTETFQIDPTLSLEQPGSAPYVHTRAWPEDVETAQAAVRNARALADFVIVSMHWGVPPLWRAPSQRDLACYQQPVGHALIQAGADLVVGHHPHSLQGIEVYRGRPIFYSLGNFLFGSQDGDVYAPLARNLPYDYEDKPDRQWSESIILQVTPDRSGTVTYEAWPVLLDKVGYPHLLEGDEAQAVIQRLAALSAPLGSELVFEEGRGRLML
jgi:poly-gamma-glutamate capsule biosynthesis protein CapA/YwtB (metallophosphatase superfamily)